MYEYIKGEVAELTPTYAVIEAQGVGYMVNISLNTYSQIENSPSVRLYLHFVVRDDTRLFYGFASKQEREMFRLLISVSGVGGGTARMVLSTYSPDELASIIRADNAALLKNVKGLGMKTAQKIIVDLRDKILGLQNDSTTTPTVEAAMAGSQTVSEAMAALAMLGFNKGASEKAVRTIIQQNPNAAVETVIKMALKQL